MKKLSFLMGIALILTCGCTGSKWINTDILDFEPASVSISKRTLEGMIVSETRQLHASVLPTEASKKDIVWSSSDSAVASVDENGLVTATGTGEAKIYAVCSVKESLRDSCLVTVSGASGIRIYDYLLDEVVEPSVTYIRNSTGSRDYKMFIAVHNSYDKSVTITSSDPEVAAVTPKEVDGGAGFTVTPGEKLGKTVISVQSQANEDVKASFEVVLETVSVTGLKLSLNADGSGADKAISSSVTVGRTIPVRVVFLTDKPGTDTPENTGISVASANTAVATVDARGTYDKATQTVSFNVSMIDDPANAPDGESVITATSDDGSFTATITVKAKCPAVESVAISRTESDPIHAGDTCHLSCALTPADAYVQSVVWSSADENVATVDQNGVVTVKSDFVFDSANAAATEIMIRVASTANPSAYAECKIKPYQYVDATGVMVTDQWGNRMRGTSSTTSKITAGDAKTNNACIQYCAGTGKNKTDLFNQLKEWAVASPAVAGVDKCGCIPVYLTATPYPYTYPTIADPDQPFYWCCYSNSRFSVAGEEFKDGSSATGWGGYSKDDGKSRMFLGHTCKFFTGHTSSTADVLYVRVFRYVPGADNSTLQSKPLLFRFSVHTIYKDNSSYGNPLVKNDDGTAAVYRPINTTGIPNPFADPCPAKWTGPMPTPGNYMLLNTDGSITGETATWGEIPVPSSIIEY